MKRLLTTTAIVVGALYFGPLQSADAALLVLSDAAGNCGTCQGIVYTLEMSATAGNPTANFALTISGENVPNIPPGSGDSIGGRTAVEAFAFGDPAGDVSTASVSSPAGYTFVDGGLSNSGGSGDCNMTGSFFCFHDLTVTQVVGLHGTLVFDFSVTTATGDWSHYGDTAADRPAFKINWLGSANNYDLVSKDIPVNTACPDCAPTPVIVDAREPASLAVLGFGLLGIGAVAARRQPERDGG